MFPTNHLGITNMFIFFDIYLLSACKFIFGICYPLVISKNNICLVDLLHNKSVRKDINVGCQRFIKHRSIFFSHNYIYLCYYGKLDCIVIAYSTLIDIQLDYIS